MADGFFPLTSEQQEWAARAADLAQREIAPRAAETDRTGTFPSEGLAVLKREGFWKLRVSREHGGLEEDLLTTVLVTEALAKRCASTSCKRRCKTDPGRRLKTDPPWRGVLRSGGPHAGGGGSGGDPGIKQAGQEHSRHRANAEGVAQHGAALCTQRRVAAVRA